VSIGAEAVSIDTRAILALCSRHSARGGNAAPLTTTEYHDLTLALRDRELRPGDLFTLDGTRLADVARRVPERSRAQLEPQRLRPLLDRGAQVALRLADLEARGIWVCGRGDAEYPSRYRTRLGAAAPPLVYGCGPTGLLERGGLAVVGSRDADPVSLQHAIDAGDIAARADVPIVSGAARGVDEESMLAALRSGGTSVGVLADSLLKISVRPAYRDAIRAKRLVLITTYEPDAGFTVGHAMGRNRLIYALADTALVVAASEARGGTWTGAVEALKHGRTVYVIVGNPARPANELLVGYGARPVTRPADAIEGVAPASSLPELAGAVMEPTGSEKANIFTLVRPALLDILAEPRSSKEVADLLEIVPVQAKIWLDRLVAADEAALQRRKYVRAAVGGAATPKAPLAPQLDLLAPPGDKPVKQRRPARARSAASRNALVR
jgi:predicted Rossmann fold nucleotide-binding protein DprA/Smf involved in DNA uptake